MKILKNKLLKLKELRLLRVEYTVINFNCNILLNIEVLDMLGAIYSDTTFLESRETSLFLQIFNP